ncbi:MAG: hypothetical protein E7471_05050 [Ruminococcaceae bacterium]|nr:hypothetical protein [Oscillospiraceae bacterium]
MQYAEEMESLGRIAFFSLFCYNVGSSDLGVIDMKIYTLTLSPAYDIHATVEQILPFGENLAHISTREAGGKGVNISRALHAVGVPNTALVVLGKENGDEFRAALQDLDCIYLECDGRIRENLTLHTPDHREMRISFPGFSVSATLLSQLSEQIRVADDTYITLTGRVPEGLAMDAVIDFLLTLKKQGAKIVVDSRSFSLSDLAKVSPWLIKPNQEEVSTYLGENITTLEQAAAAARKLAGFGIANTMVSLGSLGALLVHDGHLYHASSPDITPISTIGAGDSSIAGFLSVASEPPEIRLKTAVAFGSAACLVSGSLAPDPKVISEMLSQIKIRT